MFLIGLLSSNSNSTSSLLSSDLTHPNLPLSLPPIQVKPHILPRTSSNRAHWIRQVSKQVICIYCPTQCVLAHTNFAPSAALQTDVLVDRPGHSQKHRAPPTPAFRITATASRNPHRPLRGRWELSQLLWMAQLWRSVATSGVTVIAPLYGS